MTALAQFVPVKIQRGEVVRFTNEKGGDLRVLVGVADGTAVGDVTIDSDLKFWVDIDGSILAVVVKA